MRLSDLTDIDRAADIFIKLIGTVLAVIIAADLLRELLARMTLAGSLAVFAFFLCLSPVAYLVRERRRPLRPERSRGGAERTPLLPPPEDEE